MPDLRVAFTSCARYADYPEQPVWDRIAQHAPHVLLLLGDQIYMDYWPRLGESRRWDLTRFEREMEQRYTKQLGEKYFSSLLTKVKGDGGIVAATWDDHDFAWNGAYGLGGQSESRRVPDDKKQVARKLFTRHFPPPAAMSSEGIYYSFSKPPHAHFVMLDTRTFRQRAGKRSSLLGESQWTWFEQQLANDLRTTVICAGSPLTQGGEDWREYPHEFDRFLSTVRGRRPGRTTQTLSLNGDEIGDSTGL